ncbi:hypothetical protein [Streptomyces crystallinus]|uniref:Uncharacterized protein n=1 Tax=Streptomyces crystallinus TaxID=68191 RepID=A0ABN1FS54_9ACTN
MSPQQPSQSVHRSRTGARAVVFALALPVLAATFAGPARAQEQKAVVAAPAHRAPAAATVTEGQIREVARGGVLTYPSVTSCLTVTVRLRGGGLVGAHASLFQVPGELRSDAILPALRKAVAGRRVAAVEVRGAVGAWHPGYFTRAIEAYGDGETVPQPQGRDFEGLAGAVALGLGQSRAAVTVEDVPDGDQIVR